MTQTEKLPDCQVGDRFIVSRIRLEESLCHRLQALGIVPGCQIHILYKKRSGTMVIRCRGARYALGAGAAKGIFGGKAV
ncbi:MAG: ferrous iron transport protein A [Clostridiales bacterium]|jgi:ferrous iron transport protein A|nr:ferrous iron transport protein A [Clostridiales bacterium]